MRVIETLRTVGFTFCNIFIDPFLSLQAQLAGDAQTEKKAPQVHSEGPGANEGPRHYPKYSDMEVNPGAPPPNKN